MSYHYENKGASIPAYARIGQATVSKGIADAARGTWLVKGDEPGLPQASLEVLNGVPVTKKTGGPAPSWAALTAAKKVKPATSTSSLVYQAAPVTGGSVAATGGDLSMPGTAPAPKTGGAPPPMNASWVPTARAKPTKVAPVVAPPSIKASAPPPPTMPGISTPSTSSGGAGASSSGGGGGVAVPPKPTIEASYTPPAVKASDGIPMGLVLVAAGAAWLMYRQVVR